MNRVEEDCFAWALLEAAGSFLDDCANSWLCAKLGAGETQAVIRDLLAGFASSGVALPAALAASLWSWANGFQGSNEEPAIRDIVARVQLVGSERSLGDRPTPSAKLVARSGGSITGTTLMIVPVGS